MPIKPAPQPVGVNFSLDALAGIVATIHVHNPWYHNMTATAPTGAELRDRALDRLRRTRAVLVRDLQRAAVQLALDPNRDDITADDIRAAVLIPPDINPCVVGAAMRELASDIGILRRVGYRPSTRPLAHCRPVAVWTLGNAGVAETWLLTHPPLDNTDADSGQ